MQIIVTVLLSKVTQFLHRWISLRLLFFEVSVLGNAYRILTQNAFSVLVCHIRQVDPLTSTYAQIMTINACTDND